MKIRRVKETDRAEWLRMRIALWPTHPVTELQQEMESFLLRPEATPVFVVERPDGKLGGFVEGSIHSHAEGCETNRVGYIEGWYVDPDLRRQGLGRRLVEALEAWATQAGCTEMASDCVATNATSFMAHSAMGYVEQNRLVRFSKKL